MRLIFNAKNEDFLMCSYSEQVVEKLQELIKKEVYKIYPKNKYFVILEQSGLTVCPDMYSSVEIRAEIEFPIQREWDF